MLCLAILLAAAPAAAQNKSTPVTMADLPDAYRAEIAESEAVGQEVFQRDEATKGAVVYIRREQSIDPRANVWITDMVPDGVKVMAIAYLGDQHMVIQEVTMLGRGEVAGSFHAYPNGIPLDARFLPMLSAIRTAASQRVQGCPGHYEMVVMPRSVGGRDEIWVFLLMAGGDGVMRVGGNVLVRVDAAGETVLETRHFTKSCLDVRMDEAPEDHRLAMAAVSHLTSDTPTPVHVFLNFKHGLPLSIITTSNGIMWNVEQGRIMPFEKFEMPN
ncbi:MAG: hypothetical protein AB7E69_16635 [Sphingomonadales bacterium]